jgi:hypothetical protein
MRRALVLWTDPGGSRGRSGLLAKTMETDGPARAEAWKIEDHGAAIAQPQELGGPILIPG